MLSTYQLIDIVVVEIVIEVMVMVTEYPCKWTGETIKGTVSNSWWVKDIWESQSPTDLIRTWTLEAELKYDCSFTKIYIIMYFQFKESLC